MNKGREIQAVANELDQVYRNPFINRTECLSLRQTTAHFSFLEAKLIFNNGEMIWMQPGSVLESQPERVVVSTFPEAYTLFKRYFVRTLLDENNSYQRGLEQLKKYCIAED